MEIDPPNNQAESEQDCPVIAYGPMPNVAIPLPAPPQIQQQQQSSKPSTTTMSTTTAASLNLNNEIDTLLLQSFSCLGTTDHEDLIKQFQSLMNNQMNEDSARFFLEMSNWNLQTAVGCYLDFCNFQTLPSMKIIQEARPTELQHAWQLQNDGTEIWPNGCYLMSASQSKRVQVPALKPGETCDILAEVPISQPAVMWRICTPNGWYFGEKIWMIPPGTCSTQAELAERMRNATPESCPQINIVIQVNME